MAPRKRRFPHDQRPVSIARKDPPCHRSLPGNPVAKTRRAPGIRPHRLGFQSIPLILWRKQTNAPNKFMGSGMLPAGAYVTLEHEYILVLRKGSKREFKKAEEKRNRHESAIFWEERNIWYSDIWMDTERVPSITIDVEGNYEQMLREQGGNTDLGTIWDSWNTTWTGNERTTTSGRWNRVIGGHGSPWRQTMTTTSTVVDARQRRTGTNTRLVERIDNVSTGDRVLNIEVVPWIRERNVNFTANNMKPNTRVYAFFDRVDVNADVKPVGGSASNTTLNGNLVKTATDFEKQKKYNV